MVTPSDLQLIDIGGAGFKCVFLGKEPGPGMKTLHIIPTARFNSVYWLKQTCSDRALIGYRKGPLLIASPGNALKRPHNFSSSIFIQS